MPTTNATEAARPSRSRLTQVVGRLGYRAAIEAFYRRNPEATQEQVRLATGAPRKAIRKAFDALVLSGRIARAKAMVLKDCSGA